MRTRYRRLALIFVLAVSGSSAAAQERIEVSSAGLALDRPAGWHTGTIADVQRNRENVRLADSEFQAAMVSRSALPIVVLTKYPEPHPSLNPSIQITLRPGLAGTPTQLLTAALEPMRKAMANFRIVAPVQAVKVSGWPAARVRTSYTLKNAAGQSFDIMSRLWLIPRGRLMFLVGMSGSQTGSEVCEAEFASALTSINIQP
jgi:hypothetical protein